MSAYDRIREKLEGGSVALLDGATGSELVRRGVRWRGHGLRTDADRVQALHEEYIAAGADVIRTNTFQLNPRIYRNVFRNEAHMRHIGAPGVGERAQELIAKACEVARAARDASGREVAIAGVMSPLEHCYRPDLAPEEVQARSEHAAIASRMAEQGVDLLLLESMNTIGEARAAAQAAIDTGLPVWVSFLTGPEYEILSGESLAEGAQAMDALGVAVIMVDGAPPDDVTRALGKIEGASERPAGASAMIGKFDPPSWKFEFHPRFAGSEAWPPDRYAGVARSWRGSGAKVIAGGHGTTPDHTRVMKEVL